MIAALALVLGVIVGIIFRPTVPLWLEPYLPIAVVAALDAVFGGMRAYLDHIFDAKVFVVSFISNVLIAALIVFVGDKLGRRQTGRRWPVVYGSGGGLGHPNLWQRGGDPASRFQGLRWRRGPPRSRTAGHLASDRLARGHRAREPLAQGRRISENPTRA
jgi:small basic protein